MRILGLPSNSIQLPKQVARKTDFKTRKPRMPETNGSSPRSHSIASIPGDGIGVEVIECTIQVLRSLEKIIGTFTLHFTTFDWGSERYKKLGAYMPTDGPETLKRYDAILFGAVGSPGMYYSARVDIPTTTTYFANR